MLGMISFFWNYQGCDLSWRSFHVHLRKRWNSLFWGEISYRYQLCLTVSIVSFKGCISLLIFCLVDLSIDVSGVLKSPTIIVLLLISPFILVSVCLREGNGNPLQYSCLENPMDGGPWWAAVHGVAKSRSQLSDFTFTFHFHALEKEMATHSSVLAWRMQGTAEPGGLPSMGSNRVGHDWSNLAAAAFVLHIAVLLCWVHI